MTLSFDKDNILLDNEKLQLDIAKIREGEFHVIKDHKNFLVQIIESNPAEKKFTVRVNGNDYEVEAKDKYDLLLQKMGMTKSASAQIKDIKAPMPGKVLGIKVKEGDSIIKGQQVLILEAMKMENTLKSPGEGKIKKIAVKENEAVEKNQLLIVLE